MTHPPPFPLRLPIREPWELLAAAADLIDNNGLHKGLFWPNFDKPGHALPNIDDPCCVFGALHAVIDHPPTRDYSDLVGEAARYIERTLDDTDPGYLDVPAWNDHPVRQQPQVSAALRRAASLAYEAAQ